ncbi:MAG TPA: carbohydrate ABC transporter permease, partial [Trueperaceae bacterium]|nr:carbohydrate ABC transporter permease [Trueperaceae bacterium]
MNRARLACNIGLIVTALVVCIPLLWMVMSSIKPMSDIFAWPPRLFPTSVTFDHYVRVLQETNFPRYFVNSIVVAAMVVVSNLAIALPAGYAFARLPIPGRDLLFLVVLGTMMIPGHVTTIPLFILARTVPLFGGNDLFGAGGTGLLNTYFGIALPHLVLTFTIFLSRQFFL